MKKRLIIIAIIIICISILVLKFFISGYTNYKDKEITIKVPSLSFLSKKDDNKLIFKSFKSILTLNIDIDKINSTFDKYLCRNDNYYYDMDNDITIINYKTYFSLVFNTIEIDYQKGKYDSNYCNKIIDYLKTNYMFSKYPETANAASNYSFSVQLDNGNNIMIHYNILDGMIQFKNGQDKYIDLISILKYKWLNIDDIKKLLDYQYENKKIDRIIEDKKTIYKTNYFNFVDCNDNNYYFVPINQHLEVCNNN